MAETRLRRLAPRLAAWGRWGIVAAVFALAVLAPTSFVAVEHTSQPEFCRSCHIMEPYYASWEHSAHGGIKCIECHFEPGAMGTIHGKFQAITQLAKYVTRTAGTRPWAEVSDASCMRSGCHTVQGLEGPVAFGRVRFDHGPHLLEARGKRLRCVTCHSQVLVDSHFAVEQSVCFTCHFMPALDGRIPERTGDCALCHGPPQGTLEVAGRPFDHAEYLGRGVECRACHADVVAGTGTVHLQRCRSCHGEPELLAAADDPVRLHRSHVTERKVECFECHVEIHHGPEDALRTHPTSDESCSSCHGSMHDAARLVLAGAGATAVEPRPSRMLETHVACAGCHTGRTSGAHSSSGLASAGEVDCLHCHGTGFAGMLAEWQGAIGRGLADARRAAGELAGRSAQAGAPAASEFQAALSDLELLERDGSRGAHNALFALDVLRSAAERLDRVRQQLGPGSLVGPALPGALHDLANSLPVAAEAACGACHLDVAGRDALAQRSRPFDHEPHLREAGLTCSTCHLAEPHGSPGHGLPAFPREQCSTCHHTESERLDPSDCGACHEEQQSFLTGSAGDLADAPISMPDKDCASCHGEPPDLVIPPPAMCVLCHEEGYDEKLAQWRDRTAELLRDLEAELTSAPSSTPTGAAARAALELVRGDGSNGVHNAALAERLLADALEGLRSR